MIVFCPHTDMYMPFYLSFTAYVCVIYKASMVTNGSLSDFSFK